MITVYIAGASKNVERARRFVHRVHGQADMKIAYDWTVDVDAAVVGDHGLTDAARTRFADNDLGAVALCDVFVGLAGDDTVGLWVELGYAIARKDLDANPPPIVIVAGGGKRSIFTAPGVVDQEVSSDDEAFAILEGLAA